MKANLTSELKLLGPKSEAKILYVRLPCNPIFPIGPIGKIGLQGSLTYKTLTSDLGSRTLNSEVGFASIRSSMNNKNNHLEINTNNLLTFLNEK